MLFDNIVLIFLLIAATALVLVFINIFIFYNITIKNWKTTNATIVSQGAVSDGDGGWKKDIVYEYYVDGHKYLNNTFTRNFRSSVPLRHQVGVTEKYMQGCIVPVFYDPDKSKKSVLDNTFSPANYIALCVSIIFYAVAYYYWV